MVPFGIEVRRFERAAEALWLAAERPVRWAAESLRMETWNVAPVFVVRDVAASVEHYRDCLGFAIKGTFGDPVEMAFVGRGGIQLMLQDAEGKRTPGPNSSYKEVAWGALFWVPDVRELHADFSELGARLTSQPKRTFYGTHEFQAVDPDGHVLCFCEANQLAA